MRIINATGLPVISASELHSALDGIAAEFFESAETDPRRSKRDAEAICYHLQQLRRRLNDCDIALLRQIRRRMRDRGLDLGATLSGLEEIFMEPVAINPDPELKAVLDGVSGSRVQLRSLIGVQLAKTYEKHFERKAGFSQSPHTKAITGPYVRFVQAVLEELGAETSEHTIARYLKAARRQ